MMRLLTTVLALLTTIASYAQTPAHARYRIHLALTPGLDLATMSGVDRNGTRVVFPNGRNFRLGTALEFPLGRAWSILFEPSYNRYTANGPYYLKYRSLEFPSGVRRYVQVQGRKRLFVNALYVPDATIRFDMELAPGAIFSATGYKSNVAGGVGLEFGRLLLEFRYHTRRTGRDDFDSFTFTYQKQSIIAGFRIF